MNPSCNINSEIVTNLKRGTIEMLLLALLSLQDQYAYELSKVLREISDDSFDIQGPSMYTALYRMEKKGYVTTRETKDGRRTRVYYHLEPEGARYLKTVLQEYDSFTQSVSTILSKTIYRAKEEDS